MSGDLGSKLLALSLKVTDTLRVRQRSALTAGCFCRKASRKGRCAGQVHLQLRQSLIQTAVAGLLGAQPELVMVTFLGLDLSRDAARRPLARRSWCRSCALSLRGNDKAIMLNLSISS